MTADSCPRFDERPALRRPQFLDLGHGAHSRHADVDDLDRVLLEEMAIFALMRAMEKAPHRLQFGLRQIARRKRDLQLVALADIAKVSVAHQANAAGVEMVCCELRREPSLHIGEIGVEALKIDFPADLKLRPDDVVLEVSRQQPHR